MEWIGGAWNEKTFRARIGHSCLYLYGDKGKGVRTVCNGLSVAGIQ